MEYKIEIYRNGQTTAPGPELFFMKDWDKKYLLYTYVFIIRGNGLTMLVDTGCGDVEQVNKMLFEEFQGNITFNLPENETINEIIKKANIDPNKVDYVFVSHLHHDHASNIDLFPNASLVLSKKGWIEYMKKERPYYYNDIIFPIRPIKHIVSQPVDKIIFVEDELEVLPGINCFWVGGHTPECMAVEVNTRLGKVVFPSDVAFTYRNIEENIPIGLNYNLWECFEAYKKIKKRADILLPPHDPKVLEKYPGGVLK